MYMAIKKSGCTIWVLSHGHKMCGDVLLHMFIQIFYRIFYISVIGLTSMIKSEVVAMVAIKTINRAMRNSRGYKTYWLYKIV
jgi:hypothetical protein